MAITKEFARQLLSAMNFLHAHNIIHTDLKLENILLAENDFETISLRSRSKSESRTDRASERDSLSHSDRRSGGERDVRKRSKVYGDAGRSTDEEDDDTDTYIVPKSYRIKGGR